MSEPAAAPLSLDDVRHVAKLARLELDERELEEYRGQLASILDHIAELSRLDLDGVQPLAHPMLSAGRLDDDRVEDPMPVETLLAIAPAVEDRFLAVPKVLGG